ncbi:glycosyltransferase family 87 protein [Pontibacter sp. H249]|uniref:glycosyltransferase family 87 protein n=1 Tax=Pontibacter sp. H249 TaxID=3133420 RepID=UPI0030BC2B75
MKKLFYKPNLWLYYILFASLVLLIGEVVNDRFTMHDLEVYHRTAERMLQTKQLYRIASDGHYVYKYSPTAALYFVPFALLPFGVAKIMFWALLTILTIVVLKVLYKQTAIESEVVKERNQNILLLAFLAVGAHVHREWHLGQVNFVLLMLYVFVLTALSNKKQLLAGILLAISLFLKPFGLIFYPYLLIKGKYKAVLASFAGLLVMGILPMLFYPSWDQFMQLNRSWISELTIELSAKQDLLADANHTIFSVLARYTPLQYLVNTGVASKIYQLLLLLVIGVSFLYFIWMGRKRQRSMMAEGAFLITLIPLFAFTSQNAFLFTLPAIIVVLYNYTALNATGKVMAVSACILIGANIRDLMGSRFYNIFENASVYTFGAVLLLALLFMIRSKYNSQITSVKHAEKSIMRA